MTNRLRLAFLCLLFCLSTISYGQEVNTAKMVHLGKTIPLKESIQMQSMDKDKLKSLKKNKPKTVNNFYGNRIADKVNEQARPVGVDPVLQGELNRNGDVIVEPKLVIEGLNRFNSGGIGVPDTNGDVGKDHYFQIVNASEFKIWDKEGNALTGVVSSNTIWSQVGVNSAGDPVVLYDQFAERWLLTEFTSPGNNSLLVAISEGEDPMGAYDVYEFNTPSFPDYPKYSIWGDVIICTSNEFLGDGLSFYFINRSQLLSGEADIDIQRHTVNYNGANGFFVLTPVDVEGFNQPSPDTKPVLLRINDDAWGTAENDRLEYFTVDTIDWNTPSNTKVSSQKIVNIAPFDSDPCSVNSFGYACVPQPGSNGVDAIAQVIMHRAVYRNFNSHESLVLNFVVDADGNNRAGIRWIELRKHGNADWTLYQEGTYAPEDGLDRYMGAISIDASGNIALAFNASSEDDYISLRYTGRRATDPLGVMTVDEYEITEGFSSSPTDRFGDYAAMNVDPADDKTFWFTGEYMGSFGNWGTKVMALVISRDSIDIGPSEIITPKTSSALGATEFPEIEVRNFGIDTQYQYNVGYIVNGGAPVIETINDTLEPDERIKYTFNSTSIDMSALGNYEIKVFTMLSGDDNYLNDTLVTNVTKLARHDLFAANVEGLGALHCEDTLYATISVSNLGTDTVHYFTYNYQLNNGANNSASSDQTIVPNGDVDISIPLADFISGQNEFSFYTSEPNGSPDEIPINDSIGRTFNYLTDPAIITLELLTDKFPEETSWTLEDEATGTIVYGGGPYPGQSTQLITETWCLDTAACYTFKIFDSAGDGLFHPAFSNGSYRIINEEGKIMANILNVNFGKSESNSFCASFDCALDVDVDIQHLSDPNELEGLIMISAMGGVGPFQYSIDGGLNFQEENLFSGLDEGSYEVLVVDENGCTYSETIQLVVCQLALFSSTIVDASGASANDGSITLDIINGNGLILYSIDGEHLFQDSPIFSDLTTGDYTIVAQDSLGCRLIIDNLLVGYGTGTKYAESNYKVKTSPNPTETGLVFVQIEGLHNKSKLEVELYNGNGQFLFDNQLVRYGQYLEMHLSLINYPPGIYYIRFKDSDINRLVKIIRL